MKMWKSNHIQASRPIIACRGENRKGERWLSSWFIQAELPLCRTASAGGDEMYNVEIHLRIIPYQRRQPSMDCVAPLDGDALFHTLHSLTLTHAHQSSGFSTGESFSSGKPTHGGWETSGASEDLLPVRNKGRYDTSQEYDANSGTDLFNADLIPVIRMRWNFSNQRCTCILGSGPLLLLDHRVGNLEH